MLIMALLAVNCTVFAAETTDILKPVIELANKGDADANLQLGAIFLVKGDYDNAFKHLKAASEKGLGFAHRQLMMMYADGLGIKRDMKEATKYANRTANSETADDKNGNAKPYAFSPDKNAALLTGRKELIDTLKKGLANGTPGALHYCATLQLFGSQDLTKDNAKAIQLFENAANRGSVVAMNQLGILAEMQGDDNAAVKWYLLAAEQNFTPAMFSLATVFQKGHGIPKNPTKLYTWMKRAADLGDNVAIQRMVAFCALEEPGFEGRQKETVDWLKKGVANDDAVSQCFLGEMYISGGPDLEKDINKGIGLLQKSCDAQNPRAYYQMGLIYYKGDGIPKDKHKAKELLQWSADRGFEEAQAALKELKFD